MNGAFNKDFEELLSYIQIRFSTISYRSIEKALETITKATVTMARNMKMARRDTMLKYSASHLHEHGRNCLRSGFTSADLFSPSDLNSVENKYERERSPERQRQDNNQYSVLQGAIQTIAKDLPTPRAIPEVLLVANLTKPA